MPVGEEGCQASSQSPAGMEGGGAEGRARLHQFLWRVDQATLSRASVLEPQGDQAAPLRTLLDLFLQANNSSTDAAFAVTFSPAQPLATALGPSLLESRGSLSYATFVLILESLLCAKHPSSH